MLAAERYKSVWNMFLQALNHDPTACLRAFQCEQHVNKRSMARWMRNNGLSVRKAKTLRKRVRDAAFFLIIMLVTFAATLLKPQKYVSSRTIQKCVEHVSTST